MSKHIRGRENLKKQLASLKKAMSNVEAAGYAGGLIIQTAAQQKVPVKTGTLRRSITIRVERRGTKLLVIIGTNLAYARRVEYGFQATDSRGRKYDQPARPYMRPAFDENKARAIAEIVAALNAQIKNAL